MPKPKVKAPVKRLRLVDPKGEKFVTLLRWLEGKGGVVQLRQDVIAEQTGIQVKSIGRAWRWLEIYGAVHIVREKSKDFGTGKLPNRYEQLMSVKDYLRDCEAIREAIRAELKPKPRPLYPRGRSVIPADELDAIRRAAKDEVRLALETAGPLPSLAANPLSHLEAEAWSAAFTAE